MQGLVRASINSALSPKREGRSSALGGIGNGDQIFLCEKGKQKMSNNMYEDVGVEVFDMIETYAEKLRNIDDGYGLFGIDDFDKLSDICNDIAVIIVDALKREQRGSIA